ncbi:hypothetical protein ACR6C2_21900 [Streptomyces sp. INA 01156]
MPPIPSIRTRGGGTRSPRSTGSSRRLPHWTDRWTVARTAPESELRMLGGDPAAVPDDVLGSFMREVASHWDKDQYPLLWRRLMPRALRHWGRRAMTSTRPENSVTSAATGPC